MNSNNDSTILKTSMADEMSRLLEVATRFEQASDRLAQALSNTGNSGNQSTITLNAGGIGVWLAVSACGVMLAVNVCLAILLVNHDRKIDDLGHYVQAIYMMAPQLKPQEK